MCKNAMLYNAPDTIYYKSAEKLLSIGTKALSEVWNFLQSLEVVCCYISDSRGDGNSCQIHDFKDYS